MSKQLKLDFDRPLSGIIDGKKTERITFTGSSDLREFIIILADKQGISISELCQKYIIDGLQRDMGLMLLIQVNKDKTLDELMRKGYV